MSTLEPTPELLAAARRVQTGTWTVAENEPGYPTDPYLAQLFDAGLVLLHYPPTRLRPDYWRLTQDGERWLRDAEADAMWSHTSGPNP
jgi:hypothetical protein